MTNEIGISNDIDGRLRRQASGRGAKITFYTNGNLRYMAVRKANHVADFCVDEGIMSDFDTLAEVLRICIDRMDGIEVQP